MSFFDSDPNSCPRDGQYFFNILVVNIGINPNNSNQALGQGIKNLWNIQNIVEPRPYIIHIFEDEEIDDDLIFEITMIPHCVVEVSQSLGICWEHMLDFDTDDPWRIDIDETDCN